MNGEIVVRRAKAADAKVIVGFNQAMAFETEGKKLDPHILGSGVAAVFEDEAKGFYVVAENSNNIIVGGLMVTFEWSDWRNGWFWWIQSVYVLPEARGRKIYRRLYEFIESEARNRGGVCGFRLYVEKNNERARRVYEKCGMTESHYAMYEETISD